MNLRCLFVGHKFLQVVSPAKKPIGWTHTLYCMHCGKTMNFVITEFPTEQSADKAASGVNESASTTETV